MREQTFTPEDTEQNIPGDQVLYWEPQQSKALLGDQDKTKQTKSTWKPRWTGPHRVKRRWKTDAGFRYEIWHTERAVKIPTHANKLTKFEGWSDELPSTSAPLDKRRAYELGGWAMENDLIVVPLQPPYNYGIGKVLEV